MNKKIKTHNNLISSKAGNLKGVIVAPPDKSISHRSLLFASLSIGISSINNLLNSDDIFRMIKVLKKLGVKKKELKWEKLHKNIAEKFLSLMIIQDLKIQKK